MYIIINIACFAITYIFQTEKLTGNCNRTIVSFISGNGSKQIKILLLLLKLSEKTFPFLLHKKSRQFTTCINKLEKTGSVTDAVRSGRPKSATSEENVLTVAQAFVQSLTKSTRLATQELGLSDQRLGEI
jgi:hypothetical protein